MIGGLSDRPLKPLRRDHNLGERFKDRMFK